MVKEVVELAAKISFKGSLKPLVKLNKGLTSAIGNITKMYGALSVAGVAFNGFMAHTLAGADAQVQLSRETGVSIEALQELGYVASVSGSSAEAMEDSMDRLSRKIGEAAIQGSEDFKRLGVSVRDSTGKVKDAETVFYEVSDAMKRMGLSAQEQKDVLSKLEIDESLLQMMQLTGKEMDNLRAKASALGTITKEDGDMIASFNDSLTTLKYGIDGVQKRIAIAFAPQLQEVADGFTDILIANKDMIQNGLKKFFELINTGLGAIFRFGKLLYNLVDNTVGFENALMLAGAAMLYVNRAMWANPVGMIIAGITALIVVVDDLTVGLEGGQSVIMDWYKDFVKYVKEIGKEFDSMVDAVTISFNSMLNDVKKGFTSYIDMFKNMIAQIIKFFQPVTDIMKSITDFEMPSLSDLNPFSDAPKRIITPSTVRSSNNIQNNNIKIEVKSDNPQLAGHHVRTELQDMLNNANVQFDKGGR